MSNELQWSLGSTAQCSFLTLLDYSIKPHNVGVHHLRHDGHLSRELRLLFRWGALLCGLDSYRDGRYPMLKHCSVYLTKLTCREGGRGREREGKREGERENGGGKRDGESMQEWIKEREREREREREMIKLKALTVYTHEYTVYKNQNLPLFIHQSWYWNSSKEWYRQ